MAYQPLTASNDKNHQIELKKEGELLIYSNDNKQFIKQYARLKVIRNTNNDGIIKAILDFYSSAEQWTNPNKQIDLINFHSVSNPNKTKKDFYLRSKHSKTSSIKLMACSRTDKYDWIRCLRKELEDSYGTTVKFDNQVESICSVWFMVSCIAIIVLFIIGEVANEVKYTYISQIVLSQYMFALIVLCTYYCSRFQWKKIKQVIKINKFWAQSLFCWLFNFIAFLLLTIHLSIDIKKGKHTSNNYSWNFCYSAVYLFSAFSIPFPAICIKLHHELKCTEKDKFREEAEMSALSPIYKSYKKSKPKITVKQWLNDALGLPQYFETFQKAKIDDMDIVRKLEEKDLKEMKIPIGDRIRIMANINLGSHSRESSEFSVNSRKSTISALYASKTIFRDNISKGVICTLYMVYFVGYIGQPLLKHKQYVELNEIMYPGYNNDNVIYTWIYDINQIFLRTFVGMSLTSVFFTLVTELIDKQITSRNWCVLWRIWNEQRNICWVFIVILITISAPFEVFYIRNLFGINADIVLNSIWIIINVFGAIMSVKYVITFSGIYNKTKHEYHEYYNYKKSQSPESPIKAFVLESVLLLSLFLTYVIFMISYFIHCFANNELNSWTDAKGWDIFRQASILISCMFQFFTLIRVKQTQKFGTIYLPRFKKRPRLILHGYYKFNCLLLIYNILYIFIFKVEYFGSKKLIDSAHSYQNMGYALAFSVSSLMLFLLSHFISSYQKWKDHEFESNADVHEDDLMINMSARKNPNVKLNQFMAQQNGGIHQQSSIDSYSPPLLNAEATSSLNQVHLDVNMDNLRTKSLENNNIAQSAPIKQNKSSIF